MQKEGVSLKRTLKRTFVVLLTLALLCVPMSVYAVSWVNSTEDSKYQYYLLEDNTAAIRFLPTGYEEYPIFYVPETLDGYTVTKFEVSAFEFSGIQTEYFVVPSTVKMLEAYCLDDNHDYVYLPEGLETISWRVSQNPNMKSIVIPTTVVSIEGMAFGWGGEPREGEELIPGSAWRTEGFTVYSYGNEVARAYAEADGHAYVDLSEYALGDLNLDEQCDMNDALTLYQMTSGTMYGTPVQRTMADVKKDGTLNTFDTLDLYGRVSGG